MIKILRAWENFQLSKLSNHQIYLITRAQVLKEKPLASIGRLRAKKKGQLTLHSIPKHSHASQHTPYLSAEKVVLHFLKEKPQLTLHSIPKHSYASHTLPLGRKGRPHTLVLPRSPGPLFFRLLTQRQPFLLLWSTNGTIYLLLWSRTASRSCE